MKCEHCSSQPPFVVEDDDDDDQDDAIASASVHFIVNHKMLQKWQKTVYTPVYTIDRNVKVIDVAKKQKINFIAIQEIRREYETLPCLFLLRSFLLRSFFFLKKRYSKNLWDGEKKNVYQLMNYIYIYK